MGARIITTNPQTYSTIQETCYPGRNQTETAPPGHWSNRSLHGYTGFWSRFGSQYCSSQLLQLKKTRNHIEITSKSPGLHQHLFFFRQIWHSTVPPSLSQGDLDYLSTSRWYPAQRPELRLENDKTPEKKQISISENTRHFIYLYTVEANIIMYIMMHSRSGNHTSYTKRWLRSTCKKSFLANNL